jgi:peptidoglycan/LPS O-acetylase OafA/YrhL
LNSARSLYLDLLRFLAAMVVLMFHLLAPPFADAKVVIPAREAVVAFFVISGFVIAFVADTKEQDWRAYAASRLARLYSVVLPAIALTGALYVVGTLVAGSFYETYSVPWLRLLVSLLYLNQSWNLTVAMLNNGPFWSLCFEFWYYVAFGFALFAPRPWNVLAIVATGAAVGPRIVLLFPIWLTGVAAYRASRAPAPIPRGLSALLFLMSATYTLFLVLHGTPTQSLSNRIEASLVEGYWSLADGQLRIFIGAEWRFLNDLYFALWVAISIYLVPTPGPTPLVPVWANKTIRFLASYTFSLYLYHAPMLFFYHSLSVQFLGTPLNLLWLLTSVLLSVLALGAITEHASGPYRRFFARALSPRLRIS